MDDKYASVTISKMTKILSNYITAQFEEKQEYTETDFKYATNIFLYFLGQKTFDYQKDRLTEDGISLVFDEINKNISQTIELATGITFENEAGSY